MVSGERGEGSAGTVSLQFREVVAKPEVWTPEC